MQAQPTFESPNASTERAAPAARRLVIDAPTRMFHWLFALSFLGAYLTADGERWRMLHVTLGYTMAGLLVFRLLYALLGPRQSGLGVLWRKVSGGPAWMRAATASLRAGALADIPWRQGSHLLMALAVFVLMAMVVPLTFTGYAAFNDWGDSLGGDWLGEVHEWFGEAFLVVVLIHLALIAGLSLARRQNHALPMLTGRVKGRGPDLVKHNRVWLATLLLVAVFAYGAWEWQQSPNGLLPTAAAFGDGSRPAHGSDDD